MFSRDEWEADNALNNYDWSLPVDADIMDICDGDCVGCWYDCFYCFDFWQTEGHWNYEEILKEKLKTC